jgi:hypothetical protein
MSFAHNSKLAKNEPSWGSVDKAKLPRAAFADEGDADKKSTWSYPHHRIEGGGKEDGNGIYTEGTMYLQEGGLDAAWSASQGGRSGKKASQEVIDHLRAHRKAIGKDKSDKGEHSVCVPAAAFCFPAHAVRFAARRGDGPPNREVEITALSGDTVPSWYFGPCLHDLSGMNLHKASLPLDYCHNSDEVVGVCHSFDTSEGKLKIGAKVVPFTDGDRASEIAYKADQGVPWESSIMFDPGTLKLQQLAAGEVSQCNGKQVEGPLTIFRKWDLRGVAVCPYGLDKNTSSKFAMGGEEFTITIQRSLNAMSVETSEKPAEAPEAVPAVATEQALQPVPTEQATPPAAAIPDRKSDGKRFLDAFGDRGGRWFAEGLSFEEAQIKYSAELSAENDELRRRLEGAKLAGGVQTADGISFGETKPLAFDPANPDPDAESRLTIAQQRYGKGFGAFANSITLPRAAAAAANN